MLAITHNLFYLRRTVDRCFVIVIRSREKGNSSRGNNFCCESSTLRQQYLHNAIIRSLAHAIRALSQRSAMWQFEVLRRKLLADVVPTYAQAEELVSGTAPEHSRPTRSRVALRRHRPQRQRGGVPT